MPAPHHSSLVTTLLEAHGHCVTTVQLHEVGLRRPDVRALVDRGVLLRLRRGLLVDRRWWEASAAWERHAVRARAFALSAGGASVGGGAGPRRLALSHHSALAVQNVALYGVDDLVHMCPVGGGRGHRSTGLQLHSGVDAEHTATVDGLLTVTPALACLQVAATFGPEAGLVSADSALRRQLCTREDLGALAEHPQLRVGRRNVAIVLARTDGRHESAGETRAAWLSHQLRFPPLVPQVVITSREGKVVARVDFLVEGTRVIVEFDGMLKYDGPAALAAEKRREDRLRELGYEVVRLTWDDLGRPLVVRRKLQAAPDRAAARAA